MDLKLLSRHLGTICLMIGGTMAFSLPWAFSQFGRRNDVPNTQAFEAAGFWSLFFSMIVCAMVSTGRR